MIDAMRAFARFWYGFLVGDDWRVALGVVVALAITVAVSQTTHLAAWWIVAASVAGLLPLSIWRAARAVNKPPAP
jgi:hypothetical protein